MPKRIAMNGAPPAGALPRAVRWGRIDAALVVVAVLAAIGAYVDGIDGAFVYDDQSQILRNDLVLRNDLIGEALTSDVWAFQGSGDAAQSPYWRPAFVGWLIVNARLLGTDDPTGWHVMSIALHAMATLLLFGVARRIGLTTVAAGAAALLFAAHPVHVESVQWISGATDLLLAVGMLGGLWGFLSLHSGGRWWKWMIAIAGTLLALGSKETGVVMPGLLLAAAWLQSPSGTSASRRLGAAVLRTSPFFVMAMAYLGMRAMVLSDAGFGDDLRSGLVVDVLSMPAVLAFYLRQLVWPVELSPSYGLHLVTADSIGVMNFAAPLLAVLAVATVVSWLVHRRTALLMAAALLVLPLLPVLHVAIHEAPHYVHDRYLYVPSAGGAMIMVALAGYVLAHWWSGARVQCIVYCASAIVSIPLLVQTLNYSRTWSDEVALWRRAMEVDPTAAFHHHQLGHALHERAQRSAAADRLADAEQDLKLARERFEAALEIRPMRLARLGHAEVLLETGAYVAAELAMRELLAENPGDVGAIDRLATSLERQRRLDEATYELRRGREQAPSHFALLTDKLAVVLYQQGRLNEAVAELETARPHVMKERDPESTLVYFHLGLLHDQLGRETEARAAFETFLGLARRYNDPTLRAHVATAQQHLRD